MLYQLSGIVNRHLLPVAVIACLAATACGDVVMYFGGPDNSKVDLASPASSVTPVRERFLANIGAYGIENLETLTGPNPNLTFGSTGITGQTGFSNGVNSFFPYSVSGTNFAYDTDSVDDWIQFSQPITAFGTYIVQGGDGSSGSPVFAPTNTLTFRLENTLLATSKDVVIAGLGPDFPFYNVVFAGVTDTDSFNRISFRETYDVDGLLYDDFIAGYVTSVPEPNSLLLLASGVALTFYRGYRKRSHRASTKLA